ncbi:hypothetical protein GCM10025858_33100 [Alicyclobacillus sacchari]|uniref:hypothetical protein n=1 Tax=Alicyclobacillus sacchari TaxID=392010 RepID=UPI0023E97362|nr:hypothetical protein [Alicyclobacillus sacchari]GMA58807.1 hypothetical protein GCM10025858_33100 [Alicyclobacillus sacchari]
MEFAYVHENVAAIRLSIEAACAKAGRDPADVRVIAVTKTAPPDIVRHWLLLASGMRLKIGGKQHAKSWSTKPPHC